MNENETPAPQTPLTPEEEENLKAATELTEKRRKVLEELS
jgi:hypothetical protein